MTRESTLFPNAEHARDAVNAELSADLEAALRPCPGPRARPGYVLRRLWDSELGTSRVYAIRADAITDERAGTEHVRRAVNASAVPPGWVTLRDYREEG